MRPFTLALRLRVRAGQKLKATYKAAISSFFAPLGLFGGRVAPRMGMAVAPAWTRATVRPTLGPATGRGFHY